MAGVALAHWGDSTRIIEAPAKLAIAPDLRPFRIILHQLAQRPWYRLAGRYRANVTLARQPEGGWTYWARAPSGLPRRRRLDGGEQLDTLLAAMQSLPPLAQAEIAAKLGIDLEALHQPLNTLIDVGALLGGLSLPSSFETAWHALDQVEPHLEVSDREAWHRHVSALGELCADLERNFDVLELAAIQDRVATASACIAALGCELGVELADGWAPLRCDLRLPFSSFSVRWQR